MTYLLEKADPGPWYLEYYAKALIPFEVLGELYFRPALSVAHWLNHYDFGPSVNIAIPDWPARFIWASFVALLVLMADHTVTKYR